MPFPLLPLPQGCLYKANPWQQQMPFVRSLRKFIQEGIRSPLAPSLLVAFYDKQRIRWRYSFAMPDIGDTTGHNKIH